MQGIYASLYCTFRNFWSNYDGRHFESFSMSDSFFNITTLYYKVFESKHDNEGH